MGKFRNGDWVRYKFEVCEIAAGTIAKVDDVFSPESLLVRTPSDGRGYYASPRELEPWTPKVGERVRMTRAVDGRKVGCGATVVADDGMSTMRFLIEFDEIQEWAHDGGRPAKENRGRWVDEADIEPLPVAAEAQPAETDGSYDAWFSEKVKEAMDDTRTSIPHDEAMASIKARLSKSTPPAPLTIRAGKFYKTRDGRKVGPIVVAQRVDDPWPWKAASGMTTYYFRHDGFSCPGSLQDHRDKDDLIAEWSTTNVSATVDALDEEYGPVAHEVTVAEPKFKVGDVVRRSGKIDSGKRLRITEVVNDNDYTVEWLVGGPGSTHRWRAHEFELVTPAPTQTPTPAIVCLIDNSHPLPATRPRVHDSIEAADKEAARLAGVHNGQEFRVFAMTGAPHKVEKTYEHEWQRLAASGETAQARQKLQDISGLTGADASTCIQRFVAKLAA